MDIISVGPQSTPPPPPPGVVGRNSFPISSHSADHHPPPFHSRSSTMSSDYPVHRHHQDRHHQHQHHHHSSLPRSSTVSSSSSQLPHSDGQHTFPRHHSHSHRIRSTTSPELRNRNQTQNIDQYGGSSGSHNHRYPPMSNERSVKGEEHHFRAHSTSHRQITRGGTQGDGNTGQNYLRHGQPSATPIHRSRVNHTPAPDNSNSPYGTMNREEDWDLTPNAHSLSSQSEYYDAKDQMMQGRGDRRPYQDISAPLETTSEHSLSGSTQASESSEPTYRRPRPRQHPRPSSPRKGYDSTNSQEIFQNRASGVAGSFPENKRYSLSSIDSPHSNSVHSSMPRKSQFKKTNSVQSMPSCPSPVIVHTGCRGGERNTDAASNQHSSDYPTFSRKILSVDEKTITSKQMPEHIHIKELSDRSPILGSTKVMQYRDPLYDKLRYKHEYEPVEAFLDVAEGGSGGGVTPPSDYSTLHPYDYNESLEVLASSTGSKSNKKKSKSKDKGRPKFILRGKSAMELGRDSTVKSKSPFVKKKVSVGSLIEGSSRGGMSSISEGQAAHHMMHRYFPDSSSSLSSAGGNHHRFKERGQDFGGGHAGTKVAQWRTPLSADDNEDDPTEEFLANKKVPGSKGKSAGSVMMKLAKKFSKKNLPITRDEGEAAAEENGKWKMKQRSNSVSNLTSVDGFAHRSLSMEHLGPLSVDPNHATGSKNITPQGSPRLVRSWSRGKLNRRSTELDNDSSVTPNFLRSGSRRNLTGDPADALFESIEQGSLESVFSVIEGNISSFNILNDDEFLPVDLSVMLGHHHIAQVLLDRGAKDSPKFCRDPSSRLSRLKALNNEAERDMYRLKGEFTSQSATNSSGVKDAERRYRRGERRIQLYRRMLQNYENADVPDAPTNIQLHVTSNRSLMVTFSEPDNINRATVTRYKIEWCKTAEFKPVVGDFVMTDLRSLEYIIPDLDKGERYFVRISAYNMRGFGPTATTVPQSAIPSSWHDLNQSVPRYEGCTDKIHMVAAQFGLTLQTDPNIASGNAISNNASSKKSTKKANPLARMFTSTVKFNKTLHPGVFLASLIYSDETRVLVTTDENIPIIEVSESTSSSIGADFVWLANLACTWENVPAMCEISDNYTSSPSVQFRNKLLHTVLDLQNALGMNDLGLLHPVPYKDLHGALVFVIIKYVKDTKGVASANNSLKWSDLPKMWKKRAAPSRQAGLEAFPVPDQIVLDAQEIIAHHYTSTRPLSRGLYFGYLKARSSVASMKIICSREYPNVLPHIKIRENPNLSSEEWAWIKSFKSPSCPKHLLSTDPLSLQNTLFPTLELFLKNLGFNKEEADQHQFYIHEAIELNEDTTILLVMPSHDNVCTAPGSSDHFADTPDFVALPINGFEIMQLYTYQRSFMTKFSIVSARLEVELLTAYQQLREAFSKDEVNNARDKKDTLEDFSSRTDQVWKQMRWIEDAVQNGRDHAAGSGIAMPVERMREIIAEQSKEVAKMKEEARKKQDDFFFLSNGGKEGEQDTSAQKNGFLRVVPSYRTGLARGTSVKLHIENTTTTLEVISLVVKQVARAKQGKADENIDLSDFYMVAGIGGGKERTLEPDYRPLQLQVTEGAKGKVYLLVKRRSEETQLNQMITSV